jgi:ribonuclease BN (tRNA processing enzyme)
MSKLISLVTLGTGTPRPEPSRHSTCNLLVIGHDHLLFDVGRGAVLQLARKGIAWSAITRLFITHHHFDHIGDLADLMITSWINGRHDPMRIVGPPGTKSIVDKYLDEIYDRDLAFREQEFSAHGQSSMAHFARPVVSDIDDGVVAEGDGWTVRAYKVVHGHKQFSDEFRRKWICLGYRIEVGDKVISISGDCVPCEGLAKLARNADLLLQCCWLPARELTNDYLRGVAAHTLACSDVVGKVATEANVKRLVLTHTRAVRQDSINAIYEDVRSDFSGPVTVAEDLQEFQI